jgi:hypothetical protein
MGLKADHSFLGSLRQISGTQDTKMFYFKIALCSSFSTGQAEGLQLGSGTVVAFLALTAQMATMT